MKRPLTLFDVTCIGVNAIVGSSIFLFPARLAGLLGPASVLAFAVSGVLLATVALCFAEAAARYSGHGGPYLYARDAFGPTAGFAIGWMCWLAEVLSWSAVADGIGLYLGVFGPFWSSALAVKSIAAVVIVTMAAINYRGVKLGAWTSNVFTIAKLVPLGLLVLAGLPRVSAAHLAPFAPHGLRPIGAACYLTYFAYSGFEVVPVPAGEVDRAERSVPLAVLASLAIATVFYMLIQTTAVGLLPELAKSGQPLADAARVALGPAGAMMIVAGAVISSVGFNAGAALGGPRYLVALGQLGDMPAAAARLHPRYGTPSAAIAATAGLALLGALALDFNSLVDISVVVICAQYLATCAAVPLLRRRKGRSAFSLPGGWLIPAIGVVSTLWLGAQGGWAEARFSLLLLATGFLLRAALKRKRVAALAACALLLMLPSRARADAWRDELVKKISPESLRALLARIAEEPHVAGSPADLRLADWIEKTMLEDGLDVQRDERTVLLSYPESLGISLVAPATAALTHLEGELLSPAERKAMKAEDLIPWNAYAPSGDVTAPVVYVNYGRAEDYDALKLMGVSLSGKIALARYSEGYRGGKTLEAERRGAAAILFYSDPADDGWAQGDALPRGPWGPPDHVQRGSNVYDFREPGDVARHPDLVLPKIPSAPMSYRGAEPILRALDGPAVPKGWQGALAFTYHVGAGAAVVRLRVKNRNEARKIVNVVGRLRGWAEPEKTVFISGHHDAWTRGAVDDGLGTAATLELARVFGELARRDRRPRRTLVFASWDAEEYTLTGSTEWGLEHAGEVTKNAVALLNVDAYRWGDRFTAIAAPALSGLVRSSLAEVDDPATGKPLLERWKASGGDVEPMGSGSDYTVFLNRLGVPCVETMFTGHGGVYHSIYDSTAWVERVDPGYRYLTALTVLNGVMAARLVDDERLPLDYAEAGRAVEGWLAALARAQPKVDVSSAAAAARELAATGPAPACANAALIRAERAFLSEEGLPGRPWFRHLLYAPRPTYDALTLPGVAEAAEEGDLTRASNQAKILEAALRRAAADLTKASSCEKTGKGGS